MAMLNKPLIEVMLSSTFVDLVEHRRQVSVLLRQHRLHPIEMEDDGSLSDHDMIDSSLAKVDAASAYLCIIGKRYGQIRECANRNPDGLSLTELEFERALGRRIPICVLIMGDDYAVPDSANEFDPIRRRKLQLFRDRAGLPHRIAAHFDTWDEFTITAAASTADLRNALDQRELQLPSPQNETRVDDWSIDEVLLTQPPTLHVAKPFTRGHEFVGRTEELGWISRWATSVDPVLIVEGIGGMGKSMLTYNWVEQLSTAARTDWAGRFWYSFYEEGASMNDFCVHALAYIDRRPPRDYRGRKTSDLENYLVKRLREAPWLLVLDGLERVLVAYHRFDKAQLRDDEAVDDPKRFNRDPFQCIQPADDRLLCMLATAVPSKILVSTRNVPSCLLNQSAGPIAGVQHRRLSGLEPDDAEAMMKAAGVHGDSRRIRTYLESNFECHPLMVGVVAGLVNTHLLAPGSFDAWLNDPSGAAAVNLATLEGLARKRDHILKVAYEALGKDERDLLGVLSFFPQAVGGEALSALNPRRTQLRSSDHPPSKSELRDADSWLGMAVVELQHRGLLITDRRTASYDLHPMVRGFVRHSLQEQESARMGRAVADYASSRSASNLETAASLNDLAHGIQIVTALTLGGHLDDAASALESSDLDTALVRLELYPEILALIQPFFSAGWDNLPDRVRDRRVQRNLSRLAAGSFWNFEDFPRAERLMQLAIASALASGELEASASYIYSYGVAALSAGKVLARERLVRLHKTIAACADEPELRLEQELFRGSLEVTTGKLIAARARLLRIKAILGGMGRSNPDVESDSLAFELYLNFRQGLLSPQFCAQGLERFRALGDRFRERMALQLIGSYHQSKSQHFPAIEALERAIAMAREISVPTAEVECQFGLSLVAVGRQQEANQVADRANAAGGRPPIELAKLYLALDRVDDARRSGLQAYAVAWADGPPNSFVWDLRECREILKKLSEPEPQLPTTKCVAQFDFEPRLRTLTHEYWENLSYPQRLNRKLRNALVWLTRPAA
jgi:hypothetical protein